MEQQGDREISPDELYAYQFLWWVAEAAGLVLWNWTTHVCS
jgi:hypothetical protein